MGTKRIYSIDLLRFIAAMMVVMFHYTFVGQKQGRNFLDVTYLADIFKYGYFGVHLFFMISGFVILLSIQKNSLLLFFKSRIVRLYPAYWIGIIITSFVVFFWGGDLFHISFSQGLINLTMLQEFLGEKHVDGVYWSLTIELLFYVMMTLLILFKKQLQKINDNHFIYFWLAASITPLFINYDNHIILKLVRFVFIFKYSSFFIAGMLFFKIFKSNALKYKLLLIPTFILSINSVNQSIKVMSMNYDTSFSLIKTSILVFSFYLVFYFICSGILDKINKPLYKKIGLLTYPLYLIHQVIGYIIFNYLSEKMNNYLLLTIVVFSMLVFSFLINKYLERPVSNFLEINFKNKIVSKFKTIIT